MATYWVRDGADDVDACYHCSQPLLIAASDTVEDGDSGIYYHATCYATASRQNDEPSCGECGGERPDVYIRTTDGTMMPIHSVPCVMDRRERRGMMAR